MVPCSHAAIMSTPICIGCIFRRLKPFASSFVITAPFLTTTLSSATAILPASTVVFNPSFCSVVIAGPGGSPVGPFWTVMSSGAMSPALAADGMRLRLSIAKSLNGLSFENMTAVSPVTLSERAVRSLPAFSIAFLMSMFLLTFTVALPFRFAFIFCICFVGIFLMFSIPMTEYSLARAASFSTSSAFRDLSIHNHRFAHGSFQYDALYLVGTLGQHRLQLVQYGINVVCELRIFHAFRAHRHVERNGVLHPQRNGFREALHHLFHGHRRHDGLGHPSLGTEVFSKHLADRHHERRFAEEISIIFEHGAHLFGVGCHAFQVALGYGIRYFVGHYSYFHILSPAVRQHHVFAEALLGPLWVYILEYYVKFHALCEVSLRLASYLLYRVFHFHTNVLLPQKRDSIRTLLRIAVKYINIPRILPMRRMPIPFTPFIR